MGLYYKKVIAVFKSRSQVMGFVEIMNNQGVYSSVISTPKEANVGCGVSAEFSVLNINKAKSIISNGRFNSFNGFFLIEKRGTHVTTTRI